MKITWYPTDAVTLARKTLPLRINMATATQHGSGVSGYATVLDPNYGYHVARVDFQPGDEVADLPAFMENMRMAAEVKFEEWKGGV